LPDKTKIAAVQIDPKLMANRENLAKILINLKIAAKSGARLIAFPECAISGYVFSSRDEAIPYMETIPGPATNEIATCCKDLDAYMVIGLLEIEGKRCFNTAVLIGPQGIIGKYRKIHLPFLGVDRYLDHGDQPFQVYKTPIGNIGMHICYDCTFPESARTLALIGADILVLPTNWPAGREKVPSLILPTRAYENRVYIVAADRVGNERGASFLGLSKIVDTLGDTLAQASRDKEEIIYAEVNLAEARQKKLVFKPGEFEMDFFADRHPELYGEISKNKSGLKMIRRPES
jgi:predicted amidohydrolase